MRTDHFTDSPKVSRWVVDFSRVELSGAERAFRDELRAVLGTVVTEEVVTYLRELEEGDPIRVTTQLLEFDDKRCRFLQCLYHAGEDYLAAPDYAVSP